MRGVLPAILGLALYAYTCSHGDRVLFFREPDHGLGVALGVVSLILRHGAGAEALAWSVLFR